MPRAKLGSAASHRLRRRRGQRSGEHGRRAAAVAASPPSRGTRSTSRTTTTPGSSARPRLAVARRPTTPARTSSSACSTPASGPSTRRSATPASRLRRRSARAASSATAATPRTSGRVRLQQQARSARTCSRRPTWPASARRPSEFCNNTTHSAPPRDSEGHGTHTATTAAGDCVAHAPLLRRRPRPGQRHRARRARDRLPRLPRAGLLQLRLGRRRPAGDQRRRRRDQLLDLAAARNPYTDPVELAFLDAFNAGISVNASAGNSGPGAGDRRPRRAVGDDGRRLDLARAFQSDAAPDRRRRRDLRRAGLDAHQRRHRATPVVLAQTLPGTAVDGTAVARRRRALDRQDRRLPARRRTAASTRASTSSRAARPG